MADDSIYSTVFDVVIVGGGAVGLGAAYEVAKSGASVLVLEKKLFFNQSGSSGDLVRMYRTMYTEDFMADLAKESLQIWQELEKDADKSLRLMTGLLNFGDEEMGNKTAEGGLLDPIKNLERLGMKYKKIESSREIIDDLKFPFKNLPAKWKGLYCKEDNGVINVQLMLRTLYDLATKHKAVMRQNVSVGLLVPIDHNGEQVWRVDAAIKHEGPCEFMARKVIITSGAYTNHILEPSFDLRLSLDIWEMTAAYWNLKAEPEGERVVFPSMWFQFCPDKTILNSERKEEKRSQLMYGFPSVPWGPPNTARIAVDAAQRRIRDPDARSSTVVSPEDIKDVQEFVRDHIDGADADAPASVVSCLQTNVYDNMFILDYVPEKFLQGGAPNSVAVFTAGWAMKFVPLLGRALKEMVLDGGSKYKLDEFKMDRNKYDTETGIHHFSIEKPEPEIKLFATMSTPSAMMSSMKTMLSSEPVRTQASGSSYPKLVQASA